MQINAAYYPFLSEMKHACSGNHRMHDYREEGEKRYQTDGYLI